MLTKLSGLLSGSTTLWKGSFLPILAGLLTLLYALDWSRIQVVKKAAKEEGKQEVIDKSKKAGKEANARSSQAHNLAQRPGAFERLQRDPLVCPNCKSGDGGNR